jgi:hypothetical protein
MARLGWLAEEGYMVITGGGPESWKVNEGAGSEMSLSHYSSAFEQRMNPILDGNLRSITTAHRKVAFEETDAVAFPGGLTGRSCGNAHAGADRKRLANFSIDEPGGTYWKQWFHL